SAWLDETDTPERLWQHAAALLGGILQAPEFLGLARAWLRCPDAALLRVGQALLHGRDPAGLPAALIDGDGDDRLLGAVRQAIGEAIDQERHDCPLTICQERFEGDAALLARLHAFAGVPHEQALPGREAP